MSKRFLSGINVTGTATLNTVADAGSNTDKFLVLDASNNVSYRTAAELYADLGIGALPAAYTSTLKHEVKASQTISKGQAVYVSSADGTNMIVSKASNVSEATSSKTMGLLETSLVTNGKGNVITEGLLSGLNTNGANAGDPVWLGVDGALIFGLINKPVAPAHLVFIGIVTRANANNGEIFVKVQNGFEMKELHNYAEGSVQNNEVIVYESATSLYKPKSIPTILGYTPVPDSRTLTINGTTYDLSANRAWTITTDASARSILRYVATANQTTFTISGGYTPGLTDVYRNGVKLDNTTDFTATNGTTIVLTNGASVNDVIEVYRYQTAFLANNALRVVTEFVATAGQTTFNVTYNSGLVDVFYNGSKLLSTEYTAGNGTSIILNFPCNVNDTLEVHAYSYAVGAFTGQAQLNGTGLVRMSGTTVTYDNATYATQSYVTTAVANLVNSAPATLDTLNELATALGNDANFATTITTSIATKLPLSGGTLTGALSGTSATFSAEVTSSGSQGRFGGWATGAGYQGNALEAGVSGGIATILGYNRTSGAYIPMLIGGNTNQTTTIGGNTIVLQNNGVTALTIASTGAATFSSTLTTGDMITNSTGGIRTASNLGFILRNDANNTNLGGFTRRSYWAGSAALDTQIFAETGYGIYLNVNGSQTSGINILSSGNVGIGTSSPTGRLMAYGSSAGNVFTSVVSNQGGSTQVGINFAPSMSDSEFASNPAQASIYATDSNYGANIIFANKTTGAVGNSLTERMRITSGGNVGIGTSSPATAGGGYTGLDIRGSGGASIVLGNTSSINTYLYAEFSGLYVQTTSTTPILFCLAEAKECVSQVGATLESERPILRGLD